MRAAREGAPDLYSADHNRMVEAVRESLVPAIGFHLERGERAEAFAAATIDEAYAVNNLPNSLAPEHRSRFGQQLSEIDPRLLLLHFPRHDDGTFVRQSVFLFSAPLSLPKSAQRETLKRAERGEIVDDGPQLWARVRPDGPSTQRLVIELVAFDAKREPHRWDAVPWRYSRRYANVDAFIRDGAAFDFGAPPPDVTRAPSPSAARALANAGPAGRVLADSDPDENARTALALLDDDRIEEALMVCGVGLTKSAEAMLYGDLDTVFFERLRRLFPRAERHALQENARTLAGPRQHLHAAARRYLRQTSPWTFAHVPDSIRTEWRGEAPGQVPLCALDDEEGPQAVWLTLTPEGVLDVAVAIAPDYVVAQPLVIRAIDFEWRRMGLMPEAFGIFG